MMMTDEHLWATRGEHARRPFQVGQDLRGYPTLAAEDETDETLVLAPGGS
jgi:hypothetical protein